MTLRVLIFDDVLAARGERFAIPGLEVAVHGDADFFILKHIWNNLDHAEVLDEIVTPVVDRYYREHPEERRFVGKVAGLDELLSELKMIRDLLTSGKPLSDIQLFSQLRNLNEIKGALQAQDNETARRMVTQVDQLLESIFSSSKFA